MTERRAAQPNHGGARADASDAEESGSTVDRLAAFVRDACALRDADDARVRLLRGAAEALQLEECVVLDPAACPELAVRCRNGPAVVRDFRRERGVRASDLATRHARCAVLALIPGDGILAAFARELRPLGPDELAVAGAAAALIGAASPRAREEGRARFLAVVAHDLRSPVTAIAMAAESLMRAPPTSLVETRVREAARRIQRGARRMSGLLADLLDFERIRLGGLELDVRNHELGPILEEVLEVLRPIADSKGVRLNARTSDPVALLPCDRERLCQLLSNLVQNAIKFTPAGGVVQVLVEARDDGACFTVEDTGPGIPKETADRIFDPYWQARHGDHRGLGLGLAIARGIAEAHGTHIEVDSRIGQGSRFRFTVPWQRSGSGRFSVLAGTQLEPRA
jgi:signal transduction histidine kinase